jgi:uncharacterized lipoprotein YehR (DUF1307 family)
MKKSLFQTLLGSIILIVVIGLFGCLNYEQTVKLNADGSGSIKIHYWTKESNVSSISKVSFEENEIKTNQYAPEVVKSAKVETHQPTQTDTNVTKHAYIEFEFKDINKLDKTKGFKDNTIKLEAKGDMMVLTHTIAKDSNANNMGMDAYLLKYEYEFPGKPENVDSKGKVDGTKITWELKYSELGSRDFVMTAAFKKGAGGMSTGVIIAIVVVVVIIIVVVVMMSKKKPAAPAAA